MAGAGDQRETRLRPAASDLAIGVGRRHPVLRAADHCHRPVIIGDFGHQVAHRERPGGAPVADRADLRGDACHGVAQLLRHVGCEQVAGARLRHALDAEPFQRFQPGAQFRLALRCGQPAVALGGVGQEQAGDPLRRDIGEGGGEQRAQGIAAQDRALDLQRVDQVAQDQGVVARNRRFAVHVGRLSVARRAPGDHPVAIGEGGKLVKPAARGRADAVQQEQHRTAAGLPDFDPAAREPHDFDFGKGHR